MNIEKGIIDYPEIRERREIYLSKEDERYLDGILLEIEEISNYEIPPKIINSKICKKCAYYEFCYI